MVGKIRRTLIRNDQDVSSETFAGEVVLVNFITGRYFALRGSGVDYWMRLAKPATPNILADSVAADYGIDSGRTLPDVLELLEKLEAESLIVATEAPAEEAIEKLDPSAKAYVAPTLDVFDELEELIALDPIHDVDPESGWPVLP